MKAHLLLILVLMASLSRAWAHSGVPLGPHGGRLLQFSKDDSIHGELTLTNGVFHVLLLDRQNKPMPVDQQVLAVTGGDRNHASKPAVGRETNGFSFPALPGEEYPLVFQFRSTPNAKPVTVRMVYDAAICSACKQPEWRCQCGENDAKKAAPSK